MTRFLLKKSDLFVALLMVLFWVMAWWLSEINKREPVYSELQQTIQSQFAEKETELHTITDNLLSYHDVEQGFPDVFLHYSLEFQGTDELSLYVFLNDSLVFWSDNNIPVHGYEKIILASGQKMIRLLNGYYYCIVKTEDNLSVAGLMPVYYNYPYQNIYLKNGYAPSFHTGVSAGLTTDTLKGTEIFNKQGEFLFSVAQPSGNTSENIPFVFVLLAFMAALASLLVLCGRLIQRTNPAISFVVPVMFLVLLLIRYLQIKFLFPSFLYNDPLFSPVHYAWNTWFASLGDLILHVFAVLTASFLLWTRYGTKVRYYRQKYKRISLIISLCLLLFLVFLGLNYLTETLIINSTLLLSFEDILKLKAVDFAGFFVIILMLMAFVFMSFVFIHKIRKNLKFRNETILFFVVLLVFAVVFYFLLPEMIAPILLFAVFTGLSVSISRKFFKISGAYGIMCLFLFTLSFGMIINQCNAEKELSFRNLYAIQLSNEQDPVGEYLFEEISRNIRNDSLFLSSISESSEPKVFAEEYLRRAYFGDYFSKYHIQVTVCRPQEILLIMPSNVERPCREFFESLKMQFGTPTMVQNFWMIDDETGRPNYLYELKLEIGQEQETDTLMVFIEMITIPRISQLGYPELLVEEKVFRKPTRFDYTYAKYYYGELITKYGDYNYPLIQDSAMMSYDMLFMTKNNYTHLVYPANSKTTIIVSLPEKRPFEKIATFSYLLIMFAVFHYLMILIVLTITGKNLMNLFSFKARLQTTGIFLVILSFVVAGIITVNFFIRYHHNKNREIIREKSYSLLVELEHKLRNYEKLGPEEHMYLSELMVKFSNVFFTDINLFSTGGRLMATSRPQVYQQGLTSEYMNPEALYRLKNMNTPYLLQHENIGYLNYTSSYLPFHNYRNEVIAYLNLPYFARENELRKEISSFLITFINFYVVLIAIAIIIALIIAHYITFPLRIIGEKLRALKPGQPNEKIPWNKQDDIGVLIEEYNRMVDKLAESTALLMKTERESAWREMAKQIAHEIKNPLTPMKLSLQNLQRAWNDKAPDYEQRLKRTSQTLIEQIDALSRIATEFSNFANMQEARPYAVDIIPVVRDVTHLYKNELINIDLKYDPALSYIILADETQLIQIMNNLLKNAVQAIPSKDMGEIEIVVEKGNGLILIHVKDNGCGIPEDVQHKIFSPNFTSKSSGTGLGLAITKKITDHIGGRISFESVLNEGSVFTVQLPEHNVD